MLIYFMRGALPWSGLKGAKSEKDKYEMIGKRSFSKLESEAPDVMNRWFSIVFLRFHCKFTDFKGFIVCCANHVHVTIHVSFYDWLMFS